MGETAMLSTYNVKEVESMWIVPIQKARTCTMSMPLGMNMVGHLSVADLLNLVVLQSIPVQRNDGFKVEADHATVNADAHAHQSVFTFRHLPTSILLP